MKKMLCSLALVLVGAWAVTAQTQPGVCGTTLDDQLQFESRLLENIEKVNAGLGATDRGGNIQYVPVHFHLVGDAAGNGKVKEARVLDQLCAMNTAFAPMNIRFYLRPHQNHGTLFNYTINNNNVYDNQTSWTVMQGQRHPNAMNIFIVNQAGSGNQTGTTLAYYSPQRDWIVSRKDQINGATNNSTLPHEVGHFFSLQHTFLGWESQPFDQTFLTWPKAPATSPGGVATERVSGNCTTAADKICDTPPDYNFGFGASTCSYSGGAQDPTGAVVAPMANNMMGYFNFCSDYVFTPQQQNVVLADRATTARNYLNNNFSPAATEINTPTDMLVSPVGGVTVPYFDEVLLEWNAVPGATYYLLELDWVTSFASPQSQSFIVSSTSRLVSTLASNRNYFWRVRPFNEYVTCATARQGSFRTSGTSAVRTIEGLTGWQVSPNPVRQGAPAVVLVQADQAFDGDIRVLDATGRQVYVQAGLHFPAGDSRIELPSSILENNGLYVVLLQSGAGQAARKVAVLNQ